MKLIIEAGSSKTECASIGEDGSVMLRKAPGMNPVTDSLFDQKLKDLFRKLSIAFDAYEVYYYGAGCVNEKVNKPIGEAIQSLTDRDIKVFVENDLLGACRGLCGSNPGIVSILGTGSNTCYYDGTEVRKTFRSGGYLIGDEGSGYQLGRQVYSRYCRGQLDKRSSNFILEHYNLRNLDPVVHLYEQEDKRTYLAQFSRMISLIQKNTADEICDIVFDEYIERALIPLVNKYRTPVFFGGSVAYHFRNIISQKLEKCNIIAACFKQSLLEGLIKFHRQ